MRAFNKLTPKKVATLTELGRHPDGGGLYLQVSKVVERTTKAWVFRYMIDGEARHMGLGSVSDFNLAEARDRARDCRQQVSKGIDPIAVKRKARDERRLADASRVTFEQCAQRYIAAHESKWTDSKHKQQWHNTLSAYAYPVIGKLPVSGISRAHIEKILEPIWNEKWDTANRLRGRIEAILDYAKVKDYRTGDNPARWKGNLQNLLPAKNRDQQNQHHAAMPYAEVPAFMATLRATDKIAARALEFAILTAMRTGEVIQAQWNEIDLNEAICTIPGNRMKAGIEHRVPLSDRAVEILKSLPRMKGNWLFPGAKHGHAISNNAMLQLLRSMSGNGYTVHGFRSSLMDWAHEQTAYPKVVIDMALAHTVGDKVEAAYRRGDLFKKRQQLMAAWAKYCSKPTAAGSNVVAIHGAAQ